MSLSGGQPIIILKEGTDRRKGRDAQANNIMAAKIIADSVKTTLGPRGMDKLLVDSIGEVLITNDGATILEELEVDHPAAKMVIQISKTQDEQTGDGTTTSVVLAGELLTKAEELLSKKIHPSQIVDGFRLAQKEASKQLEKLAFDTNRDDRDTLEKLALTSLNSKSVAGAREHIALLAVDAVLKVSEKDTTSGKYTADLNYVKLLQKKGKDLKASELIEGVVIDKEIVHSGMPKLVNQAKIILINKNLEIEKGEFDSEIFIENPSEMQMFLDNEEESLRAMVEKIAATGATVVFCQKGIDDLVQHFLSKKGIAAVRRVKKSDIEKIAKATGAKINTSLDELSPEVLGKAGKVYEQKIGDDEHVFVTGCKDPKSVTILIRGGSKYITDEAERALVDATSVVRNGVEDGKAVSGGGSTEAHISKELMSYANKIDGKKQLAVKAFAEALQVIPQTLAENAGQDPLVVLNELTTKHSKNTPDAIYYGVDVYNGGTANMKEEGVVEPLRVKKQAISSASEVTEMILRIDDVLITKSADGGAPPGMGGMPPGMGGMPPGMGGMPPGMM